MTFLRIVIPLYSCLSMIFSENRYPFFRIMLYRARAATLRARARLVDPGFAREPGVIGLADRATGARKKYRAASKALAIGLNVGGDRTPGLRAFDHDDTHVDLPWICFLDLVFVAFLTKSGRLDRASCRCSDLRGIVHLHFV
jgi:hypothetical protein